MADALRVGVIGMGFGSTVHVPSFQSEGWEVVAAWSRRTERAREAAANLGIPDVHEDYHEILARDDIDAVAIATPPAQHREMSLEAIAAGKHVICEKPFALSATEAREMRDAAASAGLTAMIAHEFRYAPQRQYIRQLLDEGYVGTPEVVTIELFLGRGGSGRIPPMAWGALAANGGGFLGGLGSHFIDGLRHWFGDVASASGNLRTLRPDRLDADGNVVKADADDTFVFTLTFRNGVVATMNASSAVAPGQGARVLVGGSEGVLFATQRGPNPEPDGIVLGAKSTERELTELPMPSQYTEIDDPRDHRMASFRLLVREFERGIREGADVRPSFDDGLRCQEVLDAVRESSRSGRVVAIGE